MILAGFGFRGSATAKSLRDAYDALGYPADALAAPADKVSAPCFQQFAAALDLPIVPIDAADLKATHTPTQAPRVLQKRGTGSVAEACALIAAGAKSRLVAQRHISSDRLATCAIAIKETA